MGELDCRGVILCDEIREEKTGKYIVIGVYSAGVVVKEPSPLRLALYFMLKMKHIGTTKFKAEMRFGNQVAGVEVGLEILDPAQIIHIPTPAMPLNLDSEGDIKVLAGLEGGDLEEVASFPVSFSRDVWSMYPTVPAPPSERSPSADPGPS